MGMRWRKLGLIYGPDGRQPWAQSHAMIPTPIRLSEDVIRIYVTFCDDRGIGRPGYVDVAANDPRKVIAVSERPLLDPGLPGTFDENGMLACSVVDLGQGRMFMYYAGFELGTQIRYRLMTGLAISEDGGTTFRRHAPVPVLDRSATELYFRCGPCCQHSANRFRLWYVAGSAWIDVQGKPMPVYDIRYAESGDGIHWPAQGTLQIPLSHPDEHGFGRPWVIPAPDGGFRMFYSVRRKSLGAYRLGYAESPDGNTWTRLDNQLNLDAGPDSFDSAAIMYAAAIEVGGRLYVFYNGNEFGRAGFAAAVLETE
jgi:hypothetical protein